MTLAQTPFRLALALTISSKRKHKQSFAIYYDLSRWQGLHGLHLRRKILSHGEYLGELYDIGFDATEFHTIQKDGSMYYAYFLRHREKTEPRGL
jgi:hypothetical protein